MQLKRRLERAPLPSSLVAHASWVPAGALLSTHLAFSAYGDRKLAPALSLAVVTVVAYFGCVLAHGYAHVLAARALTGRTVRGRLFVFGDVLDEAPDSKKFVIFAAGPVASVMIGGGLMLGELGSHGTIATIFQTVAFANFAMAAANLLPGLPLDGGRIVEAITGSPTLPLRAGRVIGAVATLVGVWLLFGGPNLLEESAVGLWLVLSGIFVFAQARRIARPPPPLATTTFKDEPVGTWARPFTGRVDADDPVPAERGAYAVADRGRLAGVLPPGAKPGARCGDVMLTWRPELGLRTTAPLTRALERLASRSTPVVVVVDEKGVVRGIVDEMAVRERLAGV